MSEGSPTCSKMETEIIVSWRWTGLPPSYGRCLVARRQRSGVLRVAGQAIRKKDIWSKKDLSLNPDWATFQKGDLALITEALCIVSVSSSIKWAINPSSRG